MSGPSSGTNCPSYVAAGKPGEGGNEAREGGRGRIVQMEATVTKEIFISKARPKGLFQVADKFCET